MIHLEWWCLIKQQLDYWWRPIPFFSVSEGNHYEIKRKKWKITFSRMYHLIYDWDWMINKLLGIIHLAIRLYRSICQSTINLEYWKKWFFLYDHWTIKSHWATINMIHCVIMGYHAFMIINSFHQCLLPSAYSSRFLFCMCFACCI